MSFLRDLAHDLAERKLWPLAAAPPLGLLAVIAFGGADAPRPVPPAAPPAAVPAATAEEIERLAGRRDRVRPAEDRPSGRARRDPFTGRGPGSRGRPALPAAPERERRPETPRPSSPADIVRAAERAAQANAAAVASAAARTPAPAPAPRRTTPAPAPPRTAPSPVREPQPAEPEVVRVADVRLSPEGEVAPARRGIGARAALPSVGRVVVVVRRVEPRVVELAVRPGARVRGGRCIPARRTCRALRLAVGDVARVVVPGADGRRAVHHLRVLRVAGAPAAAAVASAPARCLSAALALTGDGDARLAATAAQWTGAARRCSPPA